jgi:hypothetical protein
VHGLEGRNRGAAIAGLVLGLFGILQAAANAQDEEKPRRDLPPPTEAPAAPPRPQQAQISYRLNVSYPGHVDRENISSLSMATMDAVHLAMQDGADDAWYLRIPKWGGAFAIDTAIRYVGHEYGHLSSFSKAGYRRALFGDKDKIDSSAPKASIGKMFVSGLNPFDNSAVSVSQSDWEEIVKDLHNDPVLVARFRIAVKAGGVNQEEANLERYSERLYDNRLSYLDTMPFLISGAAVLKYPVGIEMSDIGDYIDELKGTGLRTSVGRLHALSALTLLSGSSLAAFRGFFIGLTTGEGGMVQAFKLPVADHLDIFAPELDNYLSIFGPTLRPSIPVRLYGVYVQPGYEQLFVGGASGGEPGISVRAPIVEFLQARGCAYRHSDGGSWLEASLEFLPLKWLSLSLGYAWAHGYTFHRDVFGASNDLVEAGERSLLIGVSAFYLF